MAPINRLSNQDAPRFPSDDVIEQIERIARGEGLMNLGEVSSAVRAIAAVVVILSKREN